MPGAPTDGAQQSHLASALRDDDREGVVDDECADDERDEGEDQQTRVEEAQRLADLALALLDELLPGDDLERAEAVVLQGGAHIRGDRVL